MKRIWKISWFNSDAYGWTRYVSIIIVGEKLDAKTAKKQGKNYLEKLKVDIDKYDHFRMSEIKEDGVISVVTEHIC